MKLDEPGEVLAQNIAERVLEKMQENPPPYPRWLDSKEAAAYVGMSLHFFESKRADGTGPKYSKISYKCVRYQVADLRDWMCAHYERPGK